MIWPLFSCGRISRGTIRPLRAFPNVGAVKHRPIRFQRRPDFETGSADGQRRDAHARGCFGGMSVNARRVLTGVVTAGSDRSASAAAAQERSSRTSGRPASSQRSPSSERNGGNRPPIVADVGATVSPTLAQRAEPLISCENAIELTPGRRPTEILPAGLARRPGRCCHLVRLIASTPPRMPAMDLAEGQG